MAPTPDNRAGEITEMIMVAFSRFNHHRIIETDTETYNAIYSHVYNVLQKEIGND